MKEAERIARQLKAAFEGDAWHGPSVLETLQGVTAERALTRPLAKAHSIWEIVLHISSWQKAVRMRVEGNEVETPEDGNWPEVKDKSPQAWENALQNLKESYRKLLALIQKLPDSDLDKNPPGSDNSNYIQLHGVIQHDLYHAGQIAILKKVKP